MLSYETSSLDIKKIADSGQTFRMTLMEEESAEYACGIFRCIALDRVCTAGDGRIVCPEDDDAFWADYFDLGTDYSVFDSSIDPDDSYLLGAQEHGKGIRILRQDPWEMLITFIISQRRSIPSIRTCVEALCARWGRPAGGGLYAFPDCDSLAAASLDELASCGLGYRTEYVSLAARSVSSGETDLEAMERLSDEELLAALMRLRGVGPKVANCVSLFGFHRIGAFPVDVWIDRVLKEHYPGGFPLERYSGFAGVLQQYMFYAART